MLAIKKTGILWPFSLYSCLILVAFLADFENFSKNKLSLGFLMEAFMAFFTIFSTPPAKYS